MGELIPFKPRFSAQAGGPHQAPTSQQMLRTEERPMPDEMASLLMGRIRDARRRAWTLVRLGQKTGFVPYRGLATSDESLAGMEELSPDEVKTLHDLVENGRALCRAEDPWSVRYVLLT